LEIVRDNPGYPWDYTCLSKNKFLYNDVVCQREYKKCVEKRRKEVIPVVKDVLCGDLCDLMNYVGHD
jgi:hypothetical protein